MENKYVKYGLVVLVIFVWGAIIYRVVGGLSGPDQPAPVVAVPMKVELPEARDTFALFADYPDPFIPEADSVEMTGTKKTTSSPSIAAGLAVAAPPRPETFIRYVGMIGNPGKRSKVAIISIHGKEMLVKEKEKVDGLLIYRIEKSKITILYKGEKIAILKNSPSS